MPVTLGDRLRAQALALRDGDRVRVILANMVDEPLTVSLEVPGAGAATVRRLDDKTIYLAASDPGAFRGSGQRIDAKHGIVNVALPPFGLATVDAELGTG
jgi:hypothetical protein